MKIASVIKALFLLAHELGHVAYQAPRICDYLSYYVRHYMNKTHHPTRIEHDTNDPSGKAATAYEWRYRRKYLQYVHSAHTRPENPLTLLKGIRQNNAML